MLRLPLVAWLAVAGIIGAGAFVALVGVGVVKVSPGTGGPFYSFPGAGGLPVGGATVNSMFCEPLTPSGTQVPTKCSIMITVNSGAQSLDISLSPSNIKSLTDGKVTASSSLSIKAGKPHEVAVYQVNPQGVPMNEYTFFLMNKFFKESRGWIYYPDAVSKSEVSMTGSQESCRGSFGGEVFSYDLETREAWIDWAFTSFHEFVCGKIKQVGTLGTLGAQPSVGTEVTLFVNGQPLKVGSGLTVGTEQLTAPRVASLSGFGTVEMLGSLLTGQASPQGNNFAAAWIADEKAWRIIPNSFYTDYPGTFTKQNIDTWTRAALNGCSGQGMGAKWGEYGMTTSNCAASDPGDTKRAQFIKDLDKLAVDVRSLNSQIRAYSVPISTLAIDLMKSRVTDPSGTTGGQFVATLDQAWGNPQLQIVLDAAGIQSIGVKYAVGKPRFISLMGAATTGSGGVVTITAANDGADAAFDFMANCQGVSVAPQRQDVLAGQTVSVPLKVNTLGLAADLASSCTATITDVGSGQSIQGTGTLAVKSGAQCIEGQIIPRTSQQVDQCVNGQLVSILSCPAGTTAQLDASGKYACSAATTGAVGGPLPTPVSGATAPPTATFAPRGGFVSTGPPWWQTLAIVGVIAGAAVTIAVLALRRRGGGGAAAEFGGR